MKPKIAIYSQAIGGLTPEEQDTISKADLLVYAGRPEIVSNLRLKNPDLRWAWKMIPQFVDPWDDKWSKDILWSPLRVWQYTVQNVPGWWLRDVRGNPIVNAQGQRIVNWTPYCPKELVTLPNGFQRDMRASAFLAFMFESFAKGQRFWPTWGWDEEYTINAIAFDVLVDCLGTIGPDLSLADPDGDHQAEGVSKTCSAGGNLEPLTGLMRIENWNFYKLMKQLLPKVPLILGDVSRWSGPIWYPYANGVKLENWMRVHDWHEWWTGANRGVGYDWAHRFLGLDRSSKTLLYVRRQPDWTDEKNEQRMMFGLCTTLLHDGYFVWTEDERHPLWHPAFDTHLGNPLEDPHLVYEDRQLWVRSYSEAVVFVDVENQKGWITRRSTGTA